MIPIESAQCLWEMGEPEAAVEHYQDMLRLNPSDNQGIRDVLLNCLLEMSRDEEAERLLKRDEDDGTATSLYNWALWVFRREGDTAEARRRLKEVLKYNLHVPDYLLLGRRLPRELPDLVGFGDENEAIAYAADALVNWRQTPARWSGWPGGVRTALLTRVYARPSELCVLLVCLGAD